MIGNLFQQFYNMADTVIVGQFVGKSALSAVGSVGALNFLIVGSVIGLCSGFAIPIAQRFGAQDIKGLKKYVANIIYTSAVLAVVFTAGAVAETSQHSRGDLRRGIQLYRHNLCGYFRHNVL